MELHKVIKDQKENACGKMTYVEEIGWVCENCFIYPCPYLDE